MKFILVVLLLIPPFLLAAQQSNAIRKEAISEAKLTSDGQTAIDMVNNYSKKRFNRKRTFPIFGRRYDSRSCWYSNYILDSIKGVAEKESNHTASGFRFYYGLYDRDNKRYKKEHTLIFVPTYDSIRTLPDGRDTIYHYDMEYKKDNTSFPLAYVINSTDKYVVTVHKVTGDETITQNHGDMCPPPSPPCPCNGCTLTGQNDETITCLDDGHGIKSRKRKKK